MSRRAETRAIDLPPLQDATLEWPTVDRLFSDIEKEATVLEIRLRNGPRAQTQTGESLGGARQALHSGQVGAVQLRYLHHGVEWWDTVTRAPSGARLVRIRR